MIASVSGFVASLLVVIGGWLGRQAQAPAPHRSGAGRPDGGRAVPWDRGWPRLVRRRWPSRSGIDLGEPLHLLRLRTALERGSSLAQAFDDVAAVPGPWSDGAARLTRRVRSGSGLQDALDRWVDESRPDAGVALVADALAIAGATGGSQVRAVGAVIDAMRARAALAREVRAMASQARASAAVLVVMPVGFALAVSVLDPRVRSFYVGSPLGSACVLIGLVLDAVGAWWMARLVGRVS